MIKWVVYTVGAITLSLLMASYLTIYLFPYGTPEVYQTFVFMGLSGVFLVVLEAWYFITEIT